MGQLVKGLSEEQLKLLPTEEDVVFYEEHGWFISPKILPDELLDEAFLGAQKFYRGERDARIPYEIGSSEWEPADGDAVRNNQHVSYRKKELRKLLQPIIGAIAAKLARTRGVRLFEDTLIYKAPICNNARGGIVGWHTDYAYSSVCTSSKMLSAWIPFHDIDREGAPLVVIDGSHKWKGNEHMRTFNNQDLQQIQKNFFLQLRSLLKFQ